MLAYILIIFFLIGIPTFFTLRRILKRFIKVTKTRNWISIFASVVITPILFIGIILFYSIFLTYDKQRDFDQEKWFADTQSRFEMCDYLIESEILKGKTKSEVLELLGKPDYLNSDYLWTYYLGLSKSGFGVRLNYLQLIFENEKVSDVNKIKQFD